MGQGEVLEYRKDKGNNDRRGALLMPLFWTGIITGTVAASLLIWFMRRFPLNSTEVRELSLAVFGAGLIALPSATFGFGLSVWLRHRRTGVQRYRGAIAPLFLGLPLGFVALFPPFLSYVSVVFIVIYSVIAGLFVCARSTEGEPENVMLRRHFRRCCIGAALLMAGLTVGGFFSAWVSRNACEQRLARSIAVDIMRGRPFKVLPEPRVGAERIFRDGGYATLPAGTEPNFFPWGDVGSTRIEFPFIVSVEWGWCLGPLYGSGGRRQFICIFGYIIDVGDSEIWVS